MELSILHHKLKVAEEKVKATELTSKEWEVQAKESVGGLGIKVNALNDELETNKSTLEGLQRELSVKNGSISELERKIIGLNSAVMKEKEGRINR